MTNEPEKRALQAVLDHLRVEHGDVDDSYTPFGAAAAHLGYHAQDGDLPPTGERLVGDAIEWMARNHDFQGSLTSLQEGAPR